MKRECGRQANDRVAKKPRLAFPGDLPFTPRASSSAATRTSLKGDPVAALEKGRLLRLSQSCSRDLGLLPRLAEVGRAVKLFESEGCTLPFVARYRRGYVGLPEEAIVKVHKQLERERAVEEKRLKCVKALASRRALDEQTFQYLCASDCRAEDIADIMCSRAPQTKRKTKAQAALDAGFGPAADVILSAAGQASPGGCLMRTDQLLRQAQVAASEEETDVEAAVVAILTYRLAHDQEVRSICRSMQAKRARLEVKGIVKRTSTPKGKGKVKPKQPKQQYSSYGGFRRKLDRVKPHEWLAIKRGEAAKELRVKIVFPATTQLYGCLQERYLARGHGKCLCAKMIPTVIRRAVDTIEKSLAREFRSERLTVPAEDFAIKTFTDNVSVKLMCPPIRVEKGTTVVGVDPGYVNGHKCVVISATGEVLDMFKFWTQPGASALGPEQLVQKASQWTCSLVVVGDGQGSAEAVESIRRVLPPHMNVGICVVDECGASIYSAGAVATAELPDMDISFRGAVSIARRVLDPIAEYVKLEPKNIGVGLFQHDMPPKQLDSALTQAIQWCVCQVGVDLNTASVQLLRYVAGLNAGTAKRIVEYRTSNGRFTCREELKKVKGIGAAVFQQAAGFIRVYDGSEPLDSTGIHPESYDCARQLKRLIETHRGEDLNALLQHVSCEEDSEQVRTTSAEVLTELVESDRDVRLEHPERYRPPEIEYPPYRSGCGITELEVGAHLEGSVQNVVSFGAFVHLDCAESVTGLIHVSNLLPMVTLDSLTVNQHVRVSVLEVDRSNPRKPRISLRML